MPTAKSPPSMKPRDILRRRASEFLPEIQRRFGRKSFKPTHLGDGGAGVVYRVSPTKAVKVMLGKTKYKKIPHYKRLFKLLTQYTSQALKDTYEQFYVHSTFHTSHELHSVTKVPHFVYELMEYMPTDLKKFSKQNRWTRAELKSILCQVMHSLHLFHCLGYVITDLKVENVLINPITGQIKLNDFCESYNTHTRSSCMYTYRNYAHCHSVKEDIWRLGLLIVEFLHPRVMHLVKVHRLQPLEKDYVRSIRGRLKAKQQYDYRAMIAPYVEYQKRVLIAHDDTNKELWEQLFPLVVQMLNNKPKARPSLHQLLTSEVFCNTCFTPQTDYREAFGKRYVVPELQGSSGSPRGTIADRDLSLHTPNTASSRESLSVPSETNTTPVTPPSSRHRTTQEYDHRQHKRRRRKRYTRDTPVRSSDKYTVVSYRPRTRRARKRRPWAVSSVTTTATSASRSRYRRRRRTRHWIS